MRRREFLGGLCSVVAWPLTAAAQQTARTPRVAVLIAGEETDRDVQARLSGLTQGLERLGWKDGRNIQVDYRFAEGRPDRFQSLAKELIALQPDVIVAQTPLSSPRSREKQIKSRSCSLTYPIRSALALS